LMSVLKKLTVKVHLFQILLITLKTWSKQSFHFQDYFPIFNYSYFGVKYRCPSNFWHRLSRVRHPRERDLSAKSSSPEVSKMSKFKIILNFDFEFYRAKYFLKGAQFDEIGDQFYDRKLQRQGPYTCSNSRHRNLLQKSSASRFVCCISIWIYSSNVNTLITIVDIFY
jgi:hypothetical protein